MAGRIQISVKIGPEAGDWMLLAVTKRQLAAIKALGLEVRLRK